MESLTSLAGTVWALVGNVLALIILVVVLFLFGIKAGRARLTALILSIYLGFALYTVFPFTDALVGAGGTGTGKAIMELIVYAVLSFGSYLVLRRIGTHGTGGLRALPLLIVCLLSGALVLALCYRLFDLSALYNFPKTLDLLFAPAEYFFWWFIAPLVAIFFVNR